jgi:hypothetical protein
VLTSCVLPYRFGLITARASRLQVFLFDLAVQGAATEFCCAGLMNRARGGRVLERLRVAEHCDFSCQQPCQRRSLSIVSDCWRVWRVASTKAFYARTILNALHALCSPDSQPDPDQACSSTRSSDYCCGLNFDAHAVRPPPSRMLPVFKKNTLTQLPQLPKPPRQAAATTCARYKHCCFCACPCSVCCEFGSLLWGEY